MNRVCWSRSAIQYATQVDVGGLEVDDARADAVFAAIHQPLPLFRVRHVEKDNKPAKLTSAASEKDLLAEFTQPLNSNEPRLIFVTGQRGTGKSHLVRWLKSQIGAQPDWHIVYVAKRNTSLRKVTEQILEGIDTPNAAELRRSLAKASNEIASDEEAMNALLARLDHLVAFDSAEELRTLPDLDPSELVDLRRQTHRLLGDFTFRKELSAPNGPVHRIVRLARGGAEPSEAMDEADLHLSEADLLVDPARFDDLGAEIQRLVASLQNGQLRKDIAALCDWYLERAKAEVFTGFGTDLLQVFEDVRREVAVQKKELCLFIEDLVLLHGIDKQLAQALTVPASKNLCRLRAAIAVTDGYLDSMSTFTDRAYQFVLDIELGAVGPQRLRDFVARYLNVGRLPDDWGEDGSHGAVENACHSCPDLTPCHSTFGRSTEGYGFYPFNGSALERLIAYASPGEFRPREILREVIRAPLETAEEELPVGGLFPSKEFARTLDENRKTVPVATRTAVRRENRGNPEAEISLRALYAVSPPTTDAALEQIATYLGVGVTRLDDVPTGPTGATGATGPTGITAPTGKTGPDEFEEWADGKKLAPEPANAVRKWVCEAAIDQLQNGPYGLAIRKPTKRDWQIGSHVMHPTDVFIHGAMGAGAQRSEIEFEIELSDDNALMLRGITAASRKGGRLDLVESGRWYFRFQAMLTDFVARVAAAGSREGSLSVSKACQVLAVLGNAHEGNPQGLREMLPSMLMPKSPAQINPIVQGFLKDAQGIRGTALTAIRDLATTSKGGGAPSVLDVGRMYTELRPTRLRSLDGDYDGDTEALAIMLSLQVKQDRAFKKVWSEVTTAVAKVAQYLAPDEEFTRAAELVDRAVNEGHVRDALPRSDSRDMYLAARQKVTPSSMEVYTRLSAKVAKNVGPDAIWDVLNDPLPQLEALARWGMMSHQCLQGMEEKIATNRGSGGETDADALIREFRELADMLDTLAR